MNDIHSENKSSVGSIIGLIIIIALIVIGGLYFWGKRVEDTRVTKIMTVGDQPLSQSNQNEAAVITSIDQSDDLNSINADLQNTKFENMDTELQSQIKK